MSDEIGPGVKAESPDGGLVKVKSEGAGDDTLMPPEASTAVATAIAELSAVLKEAKFEPDSPSED